MGMTRSLAISVHPTGAQSNADKAGKSIRLADHDPCVHAHALPASNDPEAPGKAAPVLRPAQLTATGRRKRKDHGAAREAGKSWTDEEEGLFLAALDLHGMALQPSNHMKTKYLTGLS